MYRSHIRNFFYVYSYASGLLISKALQKKVKENPQFIQTIKNKFLKLGGSKSPQEIFLDMGIDINQTQFRESGLQEIQNNLNKAQKLARKLKKI
ncbi:MAG: M3 family oligoendopeptidase [bacterium]|nr:M3 family oligoendopeptidase [bacterium]